MKIVNAIACDLRLDLSILSEPLTPEGELILVLFSDLLLAFIIVNNGSILPYPPLGVRGHLVAILLFTYKFNTYTDYHGDNE